MYQFRKHVYHFAVINAAAVAILLNGCATPGQSVGLGGALGAGAGAIAGGLANPGKDGEYRTRNVVMGTAVGGMAGMVTGSLVHESTEKQKQEAFERGKATAPKQKPSGNMPPLREPRVEAKWVESKIVGNRFVEGHFEYQIVEPSHWENAQ